MATNRERGDVAFLTTEPNAVVEPIRGKAMPTILHDADKARRLSAPINEALDMVASSPSLLMSATLADKRQDAAKPRSDAMNLFGRELPCRTL
ncbi:hypothetical protein OKW76_12185 [Sphingomonas sp. S1-29]|uniref:hypothetical protein n=1 Tax=Sphingomonas sp. S1-29 TaxID=2991074 RepID=UPI002240D2B1|nr:hypothetical protein [Sphingomonas sp. S1-29]UZK68793.1 hypothetical protein OKW76_12185 [Sphingomonas sp. S1-29]